jgi:hypothetical protein
MFCDWNKLKLFLWLINQDITTYGGVESSLSWSRYSFGRLEVQDSTVSVFTIPDIYNFASAQVVINIFFFFFFFFFCLYERERSILRARFSGSSSDILPSIAYKSTTKIHCNLYCCSCLSLWRRTESITEYTLTVLNTHWEATQRVMAAKLTRLTQKNSDKTALNGRELYHLQFSFQATSPETSGYTLVCTGRAHVAVWV